MLNCSPRASVGLPTIKIERLLVSEYKSALSIFVSVVRTTFGSLAGRRRKNERCISREGIQKTEFISCEPVSIRKRPFLQSGSLLHRFFASLLHSSRNEPIVYPRRLAYIQGGPSHYCSPEPVHAGVDSDPNRRRARGRRSAQRNGASGSRCCQ